MEMEQSLHKLTEEYFGSIRNEVKPCEVSLILPSGNISIILGCATLRREDFIGQVQTKATLPDDVRADELTRLANPNFNWSTLSNEYKSAFDYKENIIGKVSLSTQSGNAYDLYGPVSYENNVLNFKVALLPFMLQEQNINPESLPKPLDAKYCPPIKGNVYLILPSGSWKLFSHQLLLYPEVMTIFVGKHLVEEEWKRLSTEPEERVPKLSEFASAFEARRKRPATVKFCMPSGKVYRLHGFLYHRSATQPSCLFLNIPPFVIFGEKDPIDISSQSLPVEITYREQLMTNEEDNCKRSAVKLRKRMRSEECPNMQNSIAKVHKRLRSGEYPSRQYVLRGRIINVSANRYNLRSRRLRMIK